MNFGLENTWQLLRDTWSGWRKDNATEWGAALAYYMILSFAPLVLILLAVGRRVYGDAAARAEILQWTGRMFGPQGPTLSRTILEQPPESGTAIGIGSGLVLLFVATRVFTHLQKAMNHIWNVEWAGGSLKGVLRARFRAFLMVVILAGLLLLAVATSAVLAFLASYADRVIPGSGLLLIGANFVLSFALIILLFAALFRVLPDVVIAWRDVWVGAAVSAGLVLVGNGMLGLYLTRTDIGSAWGAAGSFLGILVWVYYSAQVYFFGAEFTQAWAHRFGSRIEPGRRAVRKWQSPAEGKRRRKEEIEEEKGEEDPGAGKGTGR